MSARRQSLWGPGMQQRPTTAHLGATQLLPERPLVVKLGGHLQPCLQVLLLRALGDDALQLKHDAEPRGAQPLATLQRVVQSCTQQA